jgi:hypothetical protein
MPKDKLDTIVLGEVSKRVLQPDRLQTMLESYSRDALSREGHNRERLRQLRHDHKETEAGIARLLELVEAGVMEAADASLRERLVNLRFHRDELSKEITDLQKRLASAEPAITPEKVGRLAILLRAKLHDGPPELRQAYARLLLSEVSVTREEIRICGSKAVLARTAAEGLGTAVPAVLSFVREWRATQNKTTNLYALKITI